MQGDATLWVAGLTGGLGGAVLTLIAQAIQRWAERPVLKIQFASAIAGCDVRTPASAHIRGIVETIGVAMQHYLRIRILNTGRGVAKNVRAAIVSIRHTNQARTITFDEEILDLHVGLVGGQTVDALPVGGFRFFDVFHSETVQVEVRAAFDFEKTPRRFSELKLGAGKFEVKVFVSAENAQSVTQTLIWEWDGTLDGFTIREA
jgi:hypothetical protein